MGLGWGGVISWGCGGGDDVAGGISWGCGGETNGVGRIFQEVVSQCVSCELIVSQSVSQSVSRWDYRSRSKVRSA